MKHIFVADGSGVKREDICGRLQCLYPEAEVKEFMSGSKLVNTLTVDCLEDILNNPTEYLVVMDVCMPWLIHDVSRLYCGKVVLQKMQESRLKCPAIIVTTEFFVREDLEKSYDAYAGYILYKALTDQSDLYKLRIDEYYAKLAKAESGG